MIQNRKHYACTTRSSLPADRCHIETCGRFVFTAISRKVVRKNVHASIPKGNMGYDQYTFPDFVAVEPTFVAFL